MIAIAWTSGDAVEHLAAFFVANQGDVLFLPAGDHLGLRLPIRDIDRRIEKVAVLRFVFSDAAQAFSLSPCVLRGIYPATITGSSFRRFRKLVGSGRQLVAQNSRHQAGYLYRTGIAIRQDGIFVLTSADTPQEVAMVENFTNLTALENASERPAFAATTLHTQKYLDALWKSI